ncbi:unnamed protein product [Peronospora belbahrii]|uniref:Protein YIF1 n=1 Tax=Peronospora belbahrii TaxID=622444 RepID=A0AAU9KXR7_9STRA|nr:unnamed protein product [Peronospora belbahrii]
MQYNSTSGVGNMPQFSSQPAMGQQRMPQRRPAHQFFQKPTASAAPVQPLLHNVGPSNQQAGAAAFPQDAHPPVSNMAPSQQFQSMPTGFQHRLTVHGNNFDGYGGGNAPDHTLQSGSNPHLHVQYPQQVQQADFINQFSSNPMAGLAMNSAQDFLQKQSEIRLKILLLPFRHKNWRRIGNGEQDESKPMQYAPPTCDSNAPDLYIPLMGFLTYILIVGYSKGTSNQFSPDVISKDASYCLVMQLIEIGYIPLVINTVVFQLLGSIAYYVSLLYTGVAVSYFTLNCMKGSVAEPTPENRLFRNYLLFGVSCLQLVLVCWISYTTAPGE